MVKINANEINEINEKISNLKGRDKSRYETALKSVLEDDSWAAQRQIEDEDTLKKKIYLYKEMFKQDFSYSNK